MVSEAAYQSVPSSAGPYKIVAGLDAEVPGVPVPEQRFIARSGDGARTVLVSVPVPGADPERFLAEAEASRRLTGPWAAPATDVPAPGGPAWHARPYLPAVPLPTALAVLGGPLPERTVRTLGACLAETLVTAHGQGLVHAGISPGAVLLAADGPRLGCFGAVRAAAPDGESRSGQPGLEPGSLPPEQVSGGRPEPPGDLYALGAVLAYAATGHTVPERRELGELPAPLCEIVKGCLARDPEARPRPGELAGALTESGGTPGHPRTAHVVAVDCAPGARPGVTPAPGWLPGRLTAAVARQSAEILAAEILATQTAPPVPTTATPEAQERERTSAAAHAVPAPVPAAAGRRFPGAPHEFAAEVPLPPTGPPPGPPSGRPVIRNRPE